MSKTLNPPTNLDSLSWFAVNYSRTRFTYELVIPNTRQTYVLGNAYKTRAYFKSIGMEDLGGRAMDMANAFIGAQVNVKEKRAWGMDVTNPKIDENMARADKALTFERLLGGDDSDDSDDLGMIL
jgi:hypothetical protein